MLFFSVKSRWFSIITSLILFSHCTHLYSKFKILNLTPTIKLLYFLELVSKELNHLAAILHVYARVWFLWSKKKIKNSFSKRKWKYFYTFNHSFREKSSKRANSTNHPVWPLICRNKPAINPKWFNSSDTNSSQRSLENICRNWPKYLGH